MHKSHDACHEHLGTQMFTENYCVRRFTRYLGSSYEQDGHSHGLHGIGEKTEI